MIPKHVAKGIAKGDLDPFTQMPFMGGSISSGVVLNTNSESKKYKFESRRKLDLPVQKNLLTKYFCFASLEAKRNFRAPRKSPTNSISLDTEATSPKQDCSVEAASCDMNPLASPFKSKNLGNSLPNMIVENGFTTQVPGFSEFQSPGTEDRLDNASSLEDTLHHQFKVPVDEPGQALLKECEGKIRKEYKMATARSPCFQHNTVNKSDQDNKLEQFFVKDDVASDMCRYGIDESTCKTSKANKKVIVRSHYFRYMSEKNDVEENEQELVLVKADTLNDNNEGIILDSSASRANYHDGIASKRKSSPNDILDQENLGPKHMRTNASNLEEKPMDAKTEEGKFGSNISHLSQYSAIVEKSLERFVSVISSYRFSSSGSRASGLRAPLRDIRNSSPTRSGVVGADFSQFAYVPKNPKTAVVRRRS